MYHCHTHFYLVGCQCREFEIIKGMSPLDYFTHEFSESDRPEGALAADADGILADVRDKDINEAVRILASGKREEAQLILLAGQEQTALLAEDNFADIQDIWIMPMSDGEVSFRFLRWQQTYKMSKDFWQTSHYLEATINNIPNLVWYKDKDGIHEKVNDSFCKTVNKTKEQVEGRGHAYIWDVEQDDPACIKSEQEVMSKEQTFVSEEIIKTGEGLRTLMTYKSPLYNLDNSVMGTVGVAIDVTQERAYEQEIIKKNQTLETIFTTIDCGVMRHTVDGARVISVNPAALKILGYDSQEELVADGFNLIAGTVIKEDRKKLEESIRTLSKEGDSVSVEYRVRHKNGEILHVVGNIKLMQENGEMIYQRFLLDCTAQKLQEKKNERRQMELLQALAIDYNKICFFDLNTGLGFPLRNDGSTAHDSNSVFQDKISLEDSMSEYVNKYVHEDDREELLQACSVEFLKKELAEKNQYYLNYRVSYEGEITYFQMKAVRAGTWDENRGVVLGFRNVDDETRNE
ncbi:MAG: PAS domain-containing protein, partial [Acetatifactor sp.]|nr:PAS domain-containing protein [Acetatifactor sp.]